MLKNVMPPEVKRPECREEIMKMKSLMYRVSSERGWSADSVIEGYNNNSINWIAVNFMGEIIGALKIVHGDPENFPIKKKANGEDNEAWPNLNIPEKNEAAEVALAVVDKPYRGDNTVFSALYAKMYWEVASMNIKYLYAILDRVIYILYRRVGYNFVEIDASQGGGRKIYWGEETFPAKIDLEEAAKYVQTSKPQLWEFMQYYK